MTSGSPATSATASPPAADGAEDSATSTPTNTPAEPTTDGGVVPTPSTAVTQTSLISTPLTTHTSSVPHSPTAPSNPAPSTIDNSALQLSSDLPVSSSGLLQTPFTSSTSISVAPDTQATDTPSTAIPAPISGNGLSTGAVVGIAVGCAVAGLVIGLLASVFLLRRRRKPDPEPRAVESRPGERRRDSRALTATPVEPVTAVSGLEQFLAIPKSDKELSGELQSLGYLVQQHVEDNYHLLPVGQDTDSLSQALEDLGLDDCRSALPKTDWLAAMVVDPRTRLVALQHVIARVIFGSLSVEPMGKMSMLPPSVSSLVRSMPPCEKHMGSPEAISVALTRWRQITAFLLNPSRSERGVIVPTDTSLEPQAKQLLGEMNKFLGRFVDEKNRQHQQDHLRDVVLECTKFGYAILSQPADFTWNFGSESDRDIMVCPGMEKVSDSQGARCQPEMMFPPEVHRV